MHSETTVIHIHDAPKGWQSNPNYLYIGRYNSHHGLQRSIWFNPFRIKDLDGLPLNDTEKRANVINKYAAYLRGNDELIAHLPELEGKTLVCWCKPEPCHGDILCRWHTCLSTLSAKNEVAYYTLKIRQEQADKPPGLEFFEGVA